MMSGWIDVKRDEKLIRWTMKWLWWVLCRKAQKAIKNYIDEIDIVPWSDESWLQQSLLQALSQIVNNSTVYQKKISLRII